MFCAADEKTQFVDFGAARFRGMDDASRSPTIAGRCRSSRRRSRGAKPNRARRTTSTRSRRPSSRSRRAEPLTRATTDAAVLLEIGERGVRLEIVDRVPGLDVEGREDLRAALAFDPKNLDRLGARARARRLLSHRTNCLLRPHALALVATRARVPRLAQCAGTRSSKRLSIDTLAVHAGQPPRSGERRGDAADRPLVDVRAGGTFGVHKGFEYSRGSGNPTRQALETCLAALEGSAYGYAFASGLAASTTLLHTLSPGDHAILGDDVYGGTFRLFDKVMRPLGVASTRVDLSDVAAVERAIRAENQADLDGDADQPDAQGSATSARSPT